MLEDPEFVTKAQIKTEEKPRSCKMGFFTLDNIKSYLIELMFPLN